MKQQEGKEGAEEGENKEPDKIPVRLRGGTGRGGRENIWGGNKGAGKEQDRDKGRRVSYKTKSGEIQGGWDDGARATRERDGSGGR